MEKLFSEMKIDMNPAHLDALTAILMHNSLYKFCIAHYKSEGNKPFKAELHPPAYKDKRDFERKHKDMIPEFNEFDVSDEVAKLNYERFDKATQDKDTEPMECMLAMLKMFDGLRINRL